MIRNRLRVSDFHQAGSVQKEENQNAISGELGGVWKKNISPSRASIFFCFVFFLSGCASDRSGTSYVTPFLSENDAKILAQDTARLLSYPILPAKTTFVIDRPRKSKKDRLTDELIVALRARGYRVFTDTRKAEQASSRRVSLKYIVDTFSPEKDIMLRLQFMGMEVSRFYPRNLAGNISAGRPFSVKNDLHLLLSSKKNDHFMRLPMKEKGKTPGLGVEEMPPLKFFSQPQTTPADRVKANQPTAVEKKEARLKSPPRKWEIAAGQTLQQGWKGWVKKERCRGDGKWTVHWNTETDYKINYALSFESPSFEAATSDLFNLYRTAKTPLYVTGYRQQCLIVISDKK